jgi:hypothetical protein
MSVYSKHLNRDEKLLELEHEIEALRKQVQDIKQSFHGDKVFIPQLYVEEIPAATPQKVQTESKKPDRAIGNYICFFVIASFLALVGLMKL